MLDKCVNCGFEVDPCINESHAGVCPRCGHPEDEKKQPVWPTLEELAGDAEPALEAGPIFVAGNTTVN